MVRISAPNAGTTPSRHKPQQLLSRSFLAINMPPIMTDENHHLQKLASATTSTNALTKQQEDKAPSLASTTSLLSTSASVASKVSRGVSIQGLTGLQPPSRASSRQNKYAESPRHCSLDELLDTKLRQVDLALDCVGEFSFEYNGLEISIKQQGEALLMSTVTHCRQQGKENQDANNIFVEEKLKDWNQMLQSSMQNDNIYLIQTNQECFKLFFTSTAERDPPEYTELEHDIHNFIVCALQIREEMILFFSSKR